MNYKGLFSCANKVALVTGGGGLIGREITRGLAEFGALVYTADTDREKAADIHDDNIKFLQLDITAEDSVNNAISEVAGQSGRLDILVNCAYPRTSDWGAKFEDIKFGSWKENVNNHLGGHFLICRAAAEQMKKQGSGSIINLASIYGVTAPDFSVYEGTPMTMPAAYASIKSGIISLTRYIAAYYGKYNVRSNAVSPGGVFDGQPDSFVERYSQKTPLGRMGRPDEIVGAVMYLASDASSYVTGENIMVDGGWTVW
ncbi:MAG: SDR family oxidoreductase [Nitrospiraceae bacterium]|nr:MAG: SDR family oxidoreductase [Nitrospiraceae bacterium]